MPEFIPESTGGQGLSPSATLVPITKLSEDYMEFSSRVNQLINSWTTETKATDYRRRCRKISVNVQDLRARGQLKPYETFVPIRLIDTNIKREQPARIAFLKQSPRIAIFKNPLDPSTNNDVIESEFTRVNQYSGWEIPFFKCDDGAATHGWDLMELELDPDNSGNFRWDHCGHDTVIFALDTRKFQANEIVIRQIPVTISQLRIFVKKYGFDPVQVEKVCCATEKTRETQNTIEQVPPSDSLKMVNKVFFREDGIIYVAWWSALCDNWLLQPRPLFLGVRHKETSLVPIQIPTGQSDLSGKPITVTQQQPQEEWVKDYETEFPFVMQVYEESEEPRIQDHKGRVFKDEFKQEVLCSIWSSFTNGCTLASNIMASPKNPQGGGAPKQNQNFVVETGKIWTEPMDFFHVPFPDPVMLQAAQDLDVQNSAENNQVSFAANNRQDTRKTAEEIKSANQQQSLINGVNVTMYSVFIRECCQKSWRLVKSFALQGKIMFCTIGGQSNNLQLIDQPWEVFAAGDVDVVQRAEKTQKQLTLWPIVGATPLGMTFLIDILKNSFPDDAARYEKELREFQQMQQQQTLLRNLQALQIGQKTGAGPLSNLGGNQQPQVQQQQPTETMSNGI